MSHFSLIIILTFVATLVSCMHRPSVVWNADGKTMENLGAMRLRNRPSVELTKGVSLYADAIHFTDKSHRSGEASGRVFLDVTPDSRYVWLPKYAYSGHANFDLRRKMIMLQDLPTVEWSQMIQIATNNATFVTIHWKHVLTEVSVNGPMRSDFSKSYPVPVGVEISPSAYRPTLSRASVGRNVFLKP